MRNLFLFAAIAVVSGIFFMGCSSNESNTDWLDAGDTDVVDDLPYSYEDGGVDEQTGWEINSDTQAYFDDAVGLKYHILSFIGRAKLIRTENVCDTLFSYTDTTLLHYDIAFFKSRNGEIGVTQYDDGGFGLSTIREGKFIEAKIHSESFWFHNTSSKDGDYPVERTWVDGKYICHRVYVVAGQGTQVSSERTFEKLGENTKMWKELLKQ